jgi:hypothetical protein
MAEGKPPRFENLQRPHLPRELTIRYAMTTVGLLETEFLMQQEQEAQRLAWKAANPAKSEADYEGQVQAELARLTDENAAEVRQRLKELHALFKDETHSSANSQLQKDYQARISENFALAEEAWQFALVNEPQLAEQWKVEFVSSMSPVTSEFMESAGPGGGVWYAHTLGLLILSFSLPFKEFPPDLQERMRRLMAPRE